MDWFWVVFGCAANLEFVTPGVYINGVKFLFTVIFLSWNYSYRKDIWQYIVPLWHFNYAKTDFQSITVWFSAKWKKCRTNTKLNWAIWKSGLWWQIYIVSYLDSKLEECSLFWTDALESALFESTWCLIAFWISA